eukprot:19929_1
MAHDKQYNNYERNQLWIQLGAGKISNTNSFVRKIPIQSSHTKKFIGGKYVHVNTYIGGKYDSCCEFIARSATSKGYRMIPKAGKGGSGSYDTTFDRNNV